jgi:hypothetical protein
MRWYVNGDLYHTRSSEEWFSRGSNVSAPISSPAPFDQPFHILLNMAMGGNFDPSASIPADFQSAEMQVEFVRVYELTGRDPIMPGEGGTEVKDDYPEGSKEPDASGNLTRGNNFANIIGPVNNGDGTAPVNFDGWLVSFNGGGAGGTVPSVTVGTDGMVHIAIGAGGSAAHAVQMMQFVPLAQGRHYEFSFDARAQANRSIGANIGQGGDPGWTTYAGQSFALTTETRTYSYQFTMMDESHIRARVEFNLGGNANDVWIGNVMIREIPERTFAEPVKTPIGNGNQIWNGTFDQGPNFMGFWNEVNTTDATFVVPDDVSVHPHWPLQPSAPFRPRILNVTGIPEGFAPADVMLTQTLIPMFRDEYRIEFDGWASAPRDIVFRVADMEGNVFYEGTIALTATRAARSHTFRLTQPNADNRNMQIQFLFGGDSADVFMDNVFLRRLTDGDGNLLRNGTFSAQVTAAGNGWTRTVSDGGAIAQGTGANVQRFRAATNAALGTTPQSTQLRQSVTLEAGIIYELTLAARAGATAGRRDISVQVGNITTLLLSVESTAAANPSTGRIEFSVPVTQTVNLDLLLGRHATGRQITGGTNHDIFLHEIRLSAIGEVVDPCAEGHTPGDPATCTTAQICTVCEIVLVDALGHAPGAAATCTTPQLCERCDYVIAAALGHAPGAAATCTTAQICTVCEVVLVAALGHTPGAAATCTTPQICTVCEEVLVAALGHTPGPAATCTTAQVCTVCNVELAPALGHTPGAPATCTTAQICTVCGDVLAPALGHTPGAPATCTTAQICTVCEVELTPALGHTTGAPATCTTAQICTVCDVVLVPAFGHSYGKFNVVADDDTKQFKVCETCGDMVIEDRIVGEIIQDRAPGVRRNGLQTTQLRLTGRTLTLELPGMDRFDDVVLSTTANNRNIEGTVRLCDLYSLRFDIKGNGSNIKVFEVISSPITRN